MSFVEQEYLLSRYQGYGNLDFRTNGRRPRSSNHDRSWSREPDRQGLDAEMELAFIFLLLAVTALIIGAAYALVVVIFWRELSRNNRDASARVGFNVQSRTASTVGARSGD